MGTKAKLQQQQKNEGKRIEELQQNDRAWTVKRRRSSIGQLKSSFAYKLVSPNITIYSGYVEQEGKRQRRWVPEKTITLTATNESIMIVWTRGDITGAIFQKESGATPPMTDSSYVYLLLYRLTATNGIWEVVWDHRDDIRFDLPLT